MTNILLYDTGDVRDELNEPIGIELIAAHLLRDLPGEVSVDIKWFPFDHDSLNPLQYDIIGVSIHINGMEVFEHLHRLCRESGFRGPIVAGNSVPTFGWEALLSRYPDLLCMIGEGEDAWTALVREYQKEHPDYSSVPNLAWMEQGRPVTTPRAVCDMRGYLPPLRPFHLQLRQRPDRSQPRMFLEPVQLLRRRSQIQSYRMASDPARYRTGTINGIEPARIDDGLFLRRGFYRRRQRPVRRTGGAHPREDGTGRDFS